MNCLRINEVKQAICECVCVCVRLSVRLRCVLTQLNEFIYN